MPKAQAARSVTEQGEPQDQRVQLVTNRGFIRRVDDWRRVQADLPSRSEAIRRLVEIGLQAKGRAS